jgi:hypothetical protein
MLGGSYLPPALSELKHVNRASLLRWYVIMHSWKKISLTEGLERSLPGHQVDCILINGWTATVFVRQPEHESLFCTTGIDLAKLADSSSVQQLADEITFEVDMSKDRSAG